jgi:outer membrane biosynthesis protein TonB
MPISFKNLNTQQFPSFALPCSALNCEIYREDEGLHRLPHANILDTLTRFLLPITFVQEAHEPEPEPEPEPEIPQEEEEPEPEEELRKKTRNTTTKRKNKKRKRIMIRVTMRSKMVKSTTRKVKRRKRARRG